MGRQFKRKLVRSTGLLGVCALALPGAAWSQGASDSAGEEGTLGEVTVTARRYAENLQDTPIAVSVFSGEALEDRQIFQSDRLTQVVPNLQFGTNAPLAGNNSSSQVFVRGIGQTDPTSTVDPGVGLYLDDVYVGTAIGARMALRDISNVQVLRGPQGTLFGRNTIGGAILLSTTAPGDEAGGSVRAGTGTDSLLDLFAAVDLPVSDSVKTRFTAGMLKQDGYVSRPDGTDLGDTDTYTFTGKMHWQVSDRLEARLLGDYTKADENGSPLVFAAINTAATFPRVASFDAGCPGTGPAWNSVPTVPNVNDPRCANAFQNAGPYRNNGTSPLESTLTNWGASGHLRYEITDALSLKAISAYRSVDWTGNRDADNTPLTILHTVYDVESWQLSHELQGTYQTERMTGVMGLYYFRQASNDIATIELNPPPPGVQRDSDNNIVRNKSWAAYTQWTYNFTDRLALTAGLRYTDDQKDSYPDQFDYATPNVKQVPVQWYEASFSATTPSATISWRPSDAVMLYFSYAEGFKGGGWNSHFNSVLTPTQQAALQRFSPETAESLEIGAKLDLLGDTLRLNGAIFTSDYTDMQITYRGPLPNGVAPFLTNAGKASIDGAELEAIWAPVSALRLEASVGYLDSSIDRLDTSPVAALPPGLVVGNALPFAPDWQMHFGAAYTFSTGNLDITPRLDVSYQSETFFDVTNTPEISQLGGYTIANVSLAMRPVEGNWNLAAGINNATDKLYRVAGNSSLSTGSGYAETAYARPREWFLKLGYEF